MKEILKENYSEDPVRNYLNYWVNFNEKDSNGDEKRRLFEIDVKWLNGDLYADALLSFGGH